MVKWKKEQEQAFTDHEHNLLVSASAGSGKTYVMISRIISHILRGECEVNQILALTFTRAAAAEMKEKLRKAITEKIVGASADERAYLTRQLRLLPLTTVGTIHSFCSSLLKSYFFEAGVDPNFDLLPEEECFPLRHCNPVSRKEQAGKEALLINFRKEQLQAEILY